MTPATPSLTPPAKTCPRCLGRRRIMINAGTGFLKRCPACNSKGKPRTPKRG